MATRQPEETPHQVGDIVRSYAPLKADDSTIRFRFMCALCDEPFQIGETIVVTIVKTHRTTRIKRVHRQCYDVAPKLRKL